LGYLKGWSGVSKEKKKTKITTSILDEEGDVLS